MAWTSHYEKVKSQYVLDGVTMRLVIGPDQGAPVFNMRIFDVQPGAATPQHSHWWEHEVFVLQGTGELRLQDRSCPLASGSAILVERNEMHQFVNTGTEIFRFMCLIPQEWLKSASGPATESMCCG